MVRSGKPAPRLAMLVTAALLLPGRQRKPDHCRTDTFVTSALCQN
jgi:hypothetical protein